jgi:PAS domain-containing protein
MSGVERQWSPQASLSEPVPGRWHLAVSAGSSGLLGWSPSDLTVIPALELLHPDDRDRLLDATAPIGRGRIPFRPLELRLLARDSRYWWTRWHLGRRRDGSLQARGVEYLTPDHEPGPPIGTWHWDADRDVVSWSPELLDMFGLRIGPPASYAAFLSFILEEDRGSFDRHVELALHDGHPFVATFRCPTGGEHDLWFHATGCRCAGGRRLAGVVKYLNPPPTWPTRSSPIGCG